MNLEGPEGNLFPGSLAHVTGWSKSRLDANVGSLVSSEALCVSVFGTLAERPDRTVALAAMLAAADGARNATSPDVLVIWPDGVLVIESKFTEPFGCCFQATQRKCSGDSVRAPI